jgi:hypothetical protein
VKCTVWPWQQYLRIYLQGLRQTLENSFTTYLFVYGMVRTVICVFQAAQAACKGDESVLVNELESQLATMKEDFHNKQGRIQVKCG